MSNTTQQTQRIRPRIPVPEFLRADPAAELRELRERVQELETEIARLKQAAHHHFGAPSSALHNTETGE